MNNIDHIVFCVSELDQGISLIKELTGVLPSYGGKHLTKGTHNALLKIGPSSYLEILAPDPGNYKIKSPRWMGIDLINKPRITRWAIKTSDIVRDAHVLEDYKNGYGQIEKGCRRLENDSTLSWQLTNPLPDPEIEVVPFLLDWGDSVHPTKNMEQFCTVKTITLTHPQPKTIRKVIDSLGLKCGIYEGSNYKIEITIDTPKGEVVLE